MFQSDICSRCFRHVFRKALVIWLLGCCVQIYAAPSDLDATFGTGGKATVPIGTPTNGDFSTAVALQRDGKVVVAGQCNGVNNIDFCVLRLDANGVVDSTFSFVGSTITTVGSANDKAAAIAVQSDGKILVGGSCLRTNSSDFCIVRYMQNGSLDLSFNGTGKVITMVSGNGDLGNAIAIQPDGKIVMAGVCGLNFCAVRYLPSGAVDTSFNTTGTVMTPVGIGFAVATSVIVQPNGKIVLSGHCYEGFCATRYDAIGGLDISFNGNGKVVTPVTLNGGRSTASALYPNGKIAIVGYCTSAFYYKFCAARYNEDGSLDLTFGGTGIVSTPMVSGHAVANSATLQPDGKLLLAGHCYNGANADYCVARYNTDGSLDTTFSTFGWISTPIGSGEDQGNAVVLQPDGKIVVAGFCGGGFCAARYLGGPLFYQSCRLDLDGDGAVLATTDALIYARVALGISGDAVINGISFPVGATRTSWAAIRSYLATHCGLTSQ